MCYTRFSARGREDGWLFSSARVVRALIVELLSFSKGLFYLLLLLFWLVFILLSAF